MEEQVETIGSAFVNHYYHLFDNDRSSLAGLYQPSSMLTFEGQKILGVDDISGKLNNLPFEQCKHVVSTIDTQPSSFTGGILIFVSGSLQLGGEDHPLRFSQMFHLIPALQGGLFVHNDIFRLNYG
ncbi:nuclear transport factor 2B [Mercurialis annua]|uniref:nuclear transport factor 2B n=1 Tax=Mercurialis annua TaxID=3986 RepID=UPI00216087FC|nr:nuclear transport factor 2B [Mercurialis annua]